MVVFFVETPRPRSPLLGPEALAWRRCRSDCGLELGWLELLAEDERTQRDRENYVVISPVKRTARVGMLWKVCRPLYSRATSAASPRLNIKQITKVYHVSEVHMSRVVWPECRCGECHHSGPTLLSSPACPFATAYKARKEAETELDYEERRAERRQKFFVSHAEASER